MHTISIATGSGFLDVAHCFIRTQWHPETKPHREKADCSCTLLNEVSELHVDEDIIHLAKGFS
jgi:hypothetical protein